jgi:hypothetical protein
MIEALPGTDRCIVTRITTENADVWAALPEVLRSTVVEVHPDIGMHSIGTYSVDLSPEMEEEYLSASNLISLVKPRHYPLGYARKFQLDNYPLEEEYVNAGQRMAPLSFPRTFKYYTIGAPLNQGREGACTGFAVQNFLNAAPLMSKGTNRDAQRIYYRAREIDEWAGEDYDGSSISAAIRAANEYGIVGTWGYLDSHDACVKWAFEGNGGIVYGMNWYEGMYVPNALGYLRPTGKLSGGHAIFGSGYNKFKDGRVFNSWGKSWGDGGLAWIGSADLAYMWRTNQIEAICATQLKR